MQTPNAIKLHALLLAVKPQIIATINVYQEHSNNLIGEVTIKCYLNLLLFAMSILKYYHLFNTNSLFLLPILILSVTGIAIKNASMRCYSSYHILVWHVCVCGLVVYLKPIKCIINWSSHPLWPQTAIHHKARFAVINSNDLKTASYPYTRLLVLHISVCVCIITPNRTKPHGQRLCLRLCQNQKDIGWRHTT